MSGTPGPLAGVTSLKLKLGLLVVASTVAVLVVAAIGRLSGVPSLVSGPVTIVAALGVTHWLAKGMVAPLREMTRAAGRMAAGDWSERIAVTSRDEVGQLAESFNAMAADLATHDEQRRALIATVSHELRTPLAAQRALLENLADGVVAPDARTLGTALAQSERLSDLVRDLLDLSRVQGGAASLDLADVPVADLLTRCIAEAELRSRGVTHEVTVEPADLVVRADPARLAQVVMNLVDNADRHSPAGGVVHLRVRAGSDHWDLDVVDTGPGIPPAQRARLFERFGTADASTGGSGLGLAIARWICELHGGRIDALDTSSGAHLRVRLPLTAVTPPSTPAPRHTEVMTMTPTPPSQPGPAAPPAPTPVPTVPPIPAPQPSSDVLSRIWPERVCSPQIGVVAAAAVIGVLAALTLPLADGPGIALTLTLAVGGSLAFVVARAWRSGWALAVWALCLTGAALVTVRDEPGLAVLGLFLAVPLFMSAFTGARTLFGLLLSGASWVLAAARGLPLLGRTLGALSVRRNLWAVLRAGAMSLLALVVFGALFASADAIVGSWVTKLVPDWRWSELTSRVFIWVFVTGLVLTAAYVAINPPRVDPARPLPPRPVRHRFEWLLPAGAVALAFVVFLVAQASALFGGHDHVLRTTGLTYAEYARGGFGQLVVVTVLTVGVLALIRFFAPENSPTDRTTKRVVVVALVAMALLVVASALHKLWLYSQAYGFTTTRIAASLTELWLALVLALVGAAAIGWTWRGAARTAAYAASALALSMPLVNVEARVAALNADRFEATGQVDVAYLQQIGINAAGTIRSTFPEEIAACALNGGYRAATGSGERHWTSWNAGYERWQEERAHLPTPSGDCAATLSVPAPYASRS